MDLNTVTEVVTVSDSSSVPAWRVGDAWLGGGTWLFSEPQPALRRLIDLDSFGWTPIEQKADTLAIAATAKIRDLKCCPRPPDWRAGHLIDQCCDALLGSFKIWNMATVGGNICLALPAGPMTSLAAALGATCIIWMPAGGARIMLAADFVTGDRRNALEPGELLRAIHIPLAALRGRAAFRQVSLTPRGRSAALLIGTASADGMVVFTITASTVRPVRLEFPSLPGRHALRDAIDKAVAPDLYHDDIHGHPEWRRHLTYNLADEILGELGTGTGA